MSAAQSLVFIAQAWGLIGLAVAAVFLIIGISQIDEDARGAIAFRPLLVPGIMVIWPLVLWRWWLLATGRDVWKLRHKPPRKSHWVVAVAMAVLIVLTLLTSFSIRQTWPADIAPQLLQAPEAAG
ncbi:MAG: hypothetical protein AAGF53_03520 [Pseudomonadota bacterium]